ncbi:MAG: hypothetical protein NWF06_02870 [Candidatus Bathyarchaeota archaeon]|nr:hypothetical protein [Candidatus Bathyarchaeum sp.]
MRWFAEHPKLSILIQTAREQDVLPRIPKIVIIELTSEEIEKINEITRKKVDELGGAENVSQLKSIGASDSHKGKFIGLHPDKAGILMSTPSKRLKKKGYINPIFEGIEQIFPDKKLQKQLDKCNYAIALTGNLLEWYGKKYPVFLGNEGISPDKYTTGFCWVLIHEFVHIIEIENKKPVFDNLPDNKRGAERIFSNYLPYEYWTKIEPIDCSANTQ